MQFFLINLLILLASLLIKCSFFYKHMCMYYVQMTLCINVYICACVIYMCISIYVCLVMYYTHLHIHIYSIYM